MTLVDVRISEPWAAGSRPSRPPVQRAAHRSVQRILWSWLAASAVAYPGGGIVHLLQTLGED